MIRIAVVTSPRPVDFVSIGRTIDDMFRKDKSVASCEVKVFSDSLGPPEIPGRSFEIECRRPDELRDLHRLRGEGHCLCSRNYVRALEWSSDCDEASIIVEDDCFFAQDWLEKTMFCAREAALNSQRTSANCWLLCLSHLYSHASMPVYFEQTEIIAGDRHLLFPSRFYRGNGAQAMAFSPRVAADVAEDTRDGLAGVYGKLWGYTDEATYLSAIARGYPLFVVDGCLVDHMNLHSTWQQSRTPDHGRTHRFVP